MKRIVLHGAATAPVESPVQPGVLTDPVTIEKTRLAPLYRVLLHNDDVTTRDFVVQVLLEVFKKPGPDAVEIMLCADFKGVALVTVLPLEEAELRVDQAHSLARTAKYPLTFTYEPEG